MADPAELGMGGLEAIDDAAIRAHHRQPAFDLDQCLDLQFCFHWYSLNFSSSSDHFATNISLAQPISLAVQFFKKSFQHQSVEILINPAIDRWFLVTASRYNISEIN